MTVVNTSVTLTPLDLAAPSRVGPRTYRKQLLRKGTIRYPHPDGSVEEVTFDEAYLRDLAEAFNAGAYDLAPFILADEKNRHALLPERYQGELKAVEVTEDGLDGILELADGAAELVDRTKGRLGVSVRIKNAVRHVDGRQFKRALHHVLGTLDPRMQGPTLGLNPWQPIDLADSDPTETVLDLTGARYQEDKMPRPTLEHLTDEQIETLTSLAAANDISLSDPDTESDEPDADDVDPDEQDTDDEGDQDADEDGEGEGSSDADDLADGAGITDDELDALIDAELDSMGVSLSADDDDSDGLDLSGDDGADVDEVFERREHDLAADDFEPDEAARLRAELARRDYMSAGVPPYLLDLAADVLALEDGSDTLDLASPLDGTHVDVRTIVTGLLDGLKGTVDLAREDGYGHEDSDGTTDQSPETQAWLAHMQAEGLIS